MKIEFILAVLAVGAYSVAARPSEKTTAPQISPEDGFDNVPQANRPWCYWWWVNGNTDKETITRDLESIRALGFGGVLMFDARGYNDNPEKFVWMPPPRNTFMDDAWRRLLVFSIHEAHRLGLAFTMNLSTCAGALKGPWPVGTDAPKRLVSRTTALPAGQRFTMRVLPPPFAFFRPIAVFAVRYEGTPVKDEEEWRNAGNLVIDRWSRERTFTARPARETIELTDRIAADGTLSWDVPAGQWCLLRFGYTLIPGHEYDVDVLDKKAVTGHYRRMAGTIMDEIGPLTGTTLTHFYSVSWEGTVPTWTEAFEDEFKKYCRYDVRPHLPVLAGWICKDGETSDRFLRDYCRARNEMFLRNFYGTMRDLSHARGVKWYSESGGPWNRAPSVFLEADQQEFLAVNDLPQGEFWLGAAHHPVPHHNRAAVATAHVYGLRRAAAESFTHMLQHWSAFPAELKARADEAFLDGVNHVVWHTFTCSPDRFGKPGIEYFAGTHLNRNITWFPQAAPLVNYLARCQYLLQQGLPVVDIAVFTGDRTYQHWGSYREKAYDDATLLIPKGYTHDVICRDALLNRAVVKDRRLVLPDGMSYGVLSVDLDADTLSLSAMRRLTELRAAGLPIVTGSRRPVRAPGMRQQDDAEVARLAKAFWTGSPTNLASSLSATGILPDCEGTFPAVHRRTEDADLYFVAGEGKGEMTFRVSGRKAEGWNAVTGERIPLQAKPTADGRTSVVLRLPEKGSLFVVFKNTPDKRAVGKPAAENRKLPLSGPWSCVFKNAGNAAEEPPALAKTFPGDLTLSTDERIRFFAGTATYRTDVTLSPAEASLPFLSLGNVRAGVVEVFVNGASCGTVWCPPWNARVKGHLRTGKNTIELRFTNTWKNRLIGDCFRDPSSRVTQSCIHYEKVSGNAKGRKNPFYRGYTTKDPLQPNGITGPIVFCDDPLPCPADVRTQDVQMNVNGLLQYGGTNGFSLGLLLHTAGWKKTLSPVNASLTEPDPVTGEMKYQLDEGKTRIANGRVKLSPERNGAVKLFHLLHFRQDIDIKAIVLAASLDSTLFAGMRWHTDEGDSGVFPKVPGKLQFFDKTVSGFSIEIPKSGKFLTFSFLKPERVVLQDDRKFRPAYTLRIGTGRDYTCRKGEVRTLTCTLSDEAGPLRTIYRKQTVIRAGEDWIPIDYKKDILAGSALDFSGFGLQDAPAGKYGRLKAVNGHFEFEKRPGVRQRFYGVNFCGTANFPEHAEAEKLVTRLLRLGYNTLRIHHYDGGCVEGNSDRLTLNPEQMDKLDYLCAKAIENGLYLTTDLFTSRPVMWKDVGIDLPGKMQGNTYKALVAVWDPAFENWKTFSKNFLTHRNPYTGRTYAEEPALCLLSLLNEGHLYMAWNEETRTSAPARTAWRDWLAEKKKQGIDFPPECIPEDSAKISIYSKANAAFALFAAEIEEKSARRQRAFLETLGVKALLTGANCRPQFAPMARTRQRCYDYVDDHFYVDHPKFLNMPFRLPSRCENTNPLFYDEFHPARTAFTRMSEFPFTVTEWNFAGPGRFRGMGGILTGALAALQEWDGLWRFAYAHSVESTCDGSGVPGYFNLATDPLMQASDRATVCLYLRGDLSPFKDKLALVVTQDAILPKGTSGRLQTPAWRNAAVWDAQVAVTMNEADAKGAHCFDLARCGTNALPPVVFHSPSGFSMEKETGEFKLETPRTCGAFVLKGTRTCGPLTVTVSEVPATVCVISLDGDPLEKSKRILLTHLTDVQGEETTYTDDTLRTLVKWGKQRILVRNGTVAVRLRLVSPERVSVYALDTSGGRTEKISAKVQDGSLAWTASVKGAFGARMLYEIVRE